MFTNWSVTYAAAITTFAPMVVMVLGRFGISILESDFILVVSSVVSALGFLWQLVNRYGRGDITAAGFRKF